MLYRIFTEDKSRETIIKLVSEQFQGFTLIPTKGYWQGIAEDSLAIEIDTGQTEAVIKIANDIKVANKQQAILIQTLDIKTQFV